MTKHRAFRYPGSKKYNIEYVYRGERRVDACFSKLEVTDFIKQLLGVNGEVSTIVIYKWGEPIAHWEREMAGALYCGIHDSFINTTSGEWSEPVCSDPECDYCATRPATPAECTHAFEHKPLTGPKGWS